MDGSAGWAVIIGLLVAISVWAAILIAGLIATILLVVFGIRKKKKTMYLWGPISTILGTGILLVMSYFVLDYIFHISLLSS